MSERSFADARRRPCAPPRPAFLVGQRRFPLGGRRTPGAWRTPRLSLARQGVTVRRRPCRLAHAAHATADAKVGRPGGETGAAPPWRVGGRIATACGVRTFARQR